MEARRNIGKLQVALGEVVRAERLRLELSQEALAEVAELNRSYLTDLENGHRTPNLATLVRVAAALGMETSGLVAAAEARLRSRR